jgi:hypothetical protein
MNEDDTIQLAMVDGRLQLVSRLKDYANCGLSLENLSLWEFVRDTYNGSKLGLDSGGKSAVHASERSMFINDSGKQTKCRVVRKKGHETMVDFVGPWMPRDDDADVYPMYCVTMLALLVPWRDIGTIYGDKTTFEAAFKIFLKNATLDQKSFLKNTQYFHESSDGVCRQRQEESILQTVQPRDIIIEDAVEQEIPDEIEELVVTEEEIEYTIDHPFGPEEHLFAEVGMNIARDMGIFTEEVDHLCPGIIQKLLAYAADREHLVQYQGWEKIIEGYGERDSEGSIIDNSTDVAPIPKNLDENVDLSVEQVESIVEHDNSHVHTLNEDQRMAHDIIINHLDAELAGKSPPQLLMNIIGQGGTGKSTLLNAISTSFAQRGVSHLLAKTALSGVAASLIGGTTLHWWAGLPVRKHPKRDNWMD